MAPTASPSLSPSMAPTEYTIFDLQITFFVEVDSKDDSDFVYETIESPWFITRYKEYLLDELIFGPQCYIRLSNCTKCCLIKCSEN